MLLYARERSSPDWRKRLSTASIVAQNRSSLASFSSMDVLEEVDLGDFEFKVEYPPPPVETCSICFEDYIPSDMASLPGCKHKFCRECLTGHVRAKLSDMVFPIYCPLCVLDSRLEEPIEVDQRTLHQLGDILEPEEYEKFETLQLSIYALSLQCPNCEQGMMVARDDLDNVLLTCPREACRARWCRACNSTISSCVKSHKCTQDARFRRLMRRKKWRYCPGCRTPIQRDQGCTHMTCSVQGCGTHFCYRCGGHIWKPGDRSNSWSAAKFHNRWCRMVFPFGTRCPIM